MSVLIRQQAPAFSATAVLADDSFHDDFSLEAFRGRYVVLFFYPFDFSFVCPSEILAFDHKLDEFKRRDCEVVGVSVDSHYTHLAWKKTPMDDGGIGPIQFALVSDLNRKIARDYGVLVDDAVALRATFLIDREGVVRHQVVNDLDMGRNVQDTLRTLDALRHVQTKGEVCPANWEEGKAGMKATPAGVAKYLKDFGLEL
jgi:peroxiredoxin (alkyl hydroperoxide reductase subunit C)